MWATSKRVPKNVHLPIILLWMATCIAGQQPEAHCSRQDLVRCKPTELGVVNIALIGKLFDSEKNQTRGVVLRGFVKVNHHQSPGNTALFGYAWIEDDGPPPWPSGPKHDKYLQKPLPKFTLETFSPSGWGGGVEIKVSIGQNYSPDSKDFGFRLDALLSGTSHTMFRIGLEGWERHNEFSIHDCHSLHGLMTPWYNMTSHAHFRNALAKNGSAPAYPPPSESPLVLVLFLMHAKSGSEHLIFQAQEILRYCEYHILDAGMQRVLVYVRQHVYQLEEYRDYLSRHMNPLALPFVTFVVWGSDLQGCEDQHYAYYHAATALSGHANVLAAYPDLDEALARCNTSLKAYLPLSSMYTNCGTCLERYKEDTDADRRMWAAAETPEAAAARKPIAQGNSTTSLAGTHTKNGTYCKWYSVDPLLQYNRTWDDTYYREENKTWAARLDPGATSYWGKHLSRVQEVKVFNMHRAELFGDNKQVRIDLDPETCPFIAHLYNIHGYRGDGTHARGGLHYFQRNWRSKWFILPEAA